MLFYEFLELEENYVKLVLKFRSRLLKILRK
jgi:hypothetical protein